ncbi:hypothetical protein Tco_1118733, partial [Tanacetum coccineum]
LKLKRLFGNEDVWVKMHRAIAWDKVENSDPQSTPQVLLSFEEYTLPVTYPEEVEETLGIPIKRLEASIDMTPVPMMKLSESSFHNIQPRKFLRSGSLSNVDYKKGYQSSKFGSDLGEITRSKPFSVRSDPKLSSERDRLIVVDRDMYVMFECERLNVG